MILVHQVPQLLNNFAYQDKLNVRATLFPDNVPTALSWEQHVFLQYLQESIESHRDEENGDDGDTAED
jgi:hypothetical protein